MDDDEFVLTPQEDELLDKLSILLLEIAEKQIHEEAVSSFTNNSKTSKK